MVMKSRIFTKIMSASVGAQAAGAMLEENADVWTVEEDVTIVGAEVYADYGIHNQNDSEYMGRAEISQSPLSLRDASILYARATLGWNTAPAFGYRHAGVATIQFPAGKGIPVREGDTVNMHLEGWGVGGAGTADFAGTAIIFYVKGTP